MQPPDLESGAPPLRHEILSCCLINIILFAEVQSFSRSSRSGCNCNTLIPGFYEDKKLMGKLTECTALTINLDIWSSKSMLGFIGFSCQVTWVSRVSSSFELFNAFPFLDSNEREAEWAGYCWRIRARNWKLENFHQQGKCFLPLSLKKVK